MAEHQHPLDAEPEGEAAVLLRVDAAGGEHPRVDHAAAAQLDPALAGAGATGPVGVADGLALADVAEHVHLGARLGEGEEVRPQPGLHALAEQRLDHVVEGALEVGHGQALVHGEQLDLVEDGRVGGVQLVGAVDAARADHVDRQLTVEQGADLHGRGVGAQHDAGLGAAVGPLHEEGVRLTARRVVRADVQGVEVEPLRLDLGALGDLVAHGHEDVLDALRERGQRVAGTSRDAVVRQRDVDVLLDQHAGVPLGLQLGLAGGEGLVHSAAGHADALAGLGLGVRGQGADLAVGEGQRGGRAGVGDLGLVERVEGVRGGEGGERLVPHALDLFRFQRLDLDRVVRLIGCRHLFPCFRLSPS